MGAPKLMVRMLSSPDEACRDFAGSSARIKVCRLEDDYVLVEGTPDALVRFAEIIAAQAAFLEDDGFEVSPDGPGQAIFAEGSNLGVYIRRTGQ